MPEFSFKFDIEESPDAKSFMFYDVTGAYSNENTGGWGAPNIEYGDVTSAKLVMRKFKGEDVKEFALPTDAEIWKDGVEIFKSEDTSGVFVDGAYEFIVYFDDEKVSSRGFGFAALIKAEVMVLSLNYRPDMDRRLKELVQEKIRLLDNLYYAGQTGQIEYFVENLTQLQKLR